MSQLQIVGGLDKSKPDVSFPVLRRGAAGMDRAALLQDLCYFPFSGSSYHKKGSLWLLALGEEPLLSPPWKQNTKHPGLIKQNRDRSFAESK